MTLNLYLLSIALVIPVSSSFGTSVSLAFVVGVFMPGETPTNAFEFAFVFFYIVCYTSMVI